MKLLFATLLLLASPLSQAASVQVGCDPSKATQQSVAHADAGDTVIVFAPGNPTTGYQWLSKEGVMSVYNSTGGGAVGSGGFYNFAIAADKKSDRKVFTFEYKRGWEQAEPASVCYVKVMVK